MKFFRKYHKWLGLVFTVFILFFAVSGLFAGTLFGLYHFHGGIWEKVSLPVKIAQVVKVLQIGDSLLVMTRSHIFMATSVSGYFLYDPEIHRYLIASSDGIYYSDDGFCSELKTFSV